MYTSLKWQAKPAVIDMLAVFQQEVQQLANEVEEMTRLGHCSPATACEMVQRLREKLADERKKLREQQATENSLKRNRDEILKKLDSLSTVVSELTNRLEKKADNAQQTSNISSSRQIVQQIQQQQSQKQSQQKQQRQIDEEVTLIETMKDKIRSLEQQLSKLLSDNSQWEAYLSQQEQFKQSLENELKKLKDPQNHASSSTVSNDRSQDEKLIQKFKNQIADAEDQTNDAKAKKEELLKNIKDLKAKLSEQSNTLAMMKEFYSSRLNSESINRVSLVTTEEVEILQAQILLYQEDCEREKQDRLKAVRRITELQAERQALQLQLKEYEQFFLNQQQQRQQQLYQQKTAQYTAQNRVQHGGYGHEPHALPYRRRGNGDIECDGQNQPPVDVNSFDEIDMLSSPKTPVGRITSQSLNDWEVINYDKGHSITNTYVRNNVSYECDNARTARGSVKDSGSDECDNARTARESVRNNGSDECDNARSVKESGRSHNIDERIYNNIDEKTYPFGSDFLKCPKCDKRFALEKHSDFLDHFDSHG